MLRKWILGIGLMAACMGLARAFPGPEKLVELRQRTPQFETKVARAVLSVAARNPGLAPGLARHLLEDLGDEPLQALMDVHADLRARYPGFDHDLAALLEQGRQNRQQIRRRFPRLRSWFLGRLQAMPEQPPRPGAYIAVHHPKLMLGLALTASQLVDEKYPELPAKWSARPGQQGLPSFVLENYPDLPEDFVHRLSPEQRLEIREAALGYLKEREEWAKQQPPGRLQEGFEALLAQHPGIAEAWGEARLQQLKARLRQFPELRQVVSQSLRSRHPGLLDKARESLDRNYPELASQLRQAFSDQLGL
ncbi:hypothetical protein JST97_22900 [bacterium]|nr:hypothetical protein [bacterium]